MMEETLQNLEHTPEYTEQPQSDGLELSESHNEQEVQKPSKEEVAAQNFARLREEKKKADRELAEIRQRLAQYESAKKNTNEDQPERDFSIAPDDLVEGRHLSAYDKKIKELREELHNYKQQTTQTAVESRLKNQYQDFDKVVNQETIQSLRELYPELASTINADPDLYTKASSAYTMIKRLGIYKEDEYTKEKEHAEYNAKKPRPLSSVSPQQGESPLSRANAFANGLTEELKAQLRAEMINARKRL